MNTNCIFINKIENLKNIKDKAPKSKIQIFSYNKLSDSIKRNNIITGPRLVDEELLNDEPKTQNEIIIIH